MEIQMRGGYTLQGYVIALNIFNYPNEYSEKLRVLSLRYLLQYNKTYYDTSVHNRIMYKYTPHNSENLIAFGMQQLNSITDRRQLQELTDVLITHGNEATRTEVLNFLRDNPDLTEVKEVKEEKKNPIGNNPIGNNPIVNNPIGYQNPIGRIIPIDWLDEKKVVVTTRTVYNDSQNVHDSAINKSVIKVLTTLFNMYKNRIDIFTTVDENNSYKDEVIDNICQILVNEFPNKSDNITYVVEDIKNNISIFGDNISLQDGFIAVWLWINDKDAEDSKVLKGRLIEEIVEMKNYCTTGKLARLMNTIQGFSDDENLCIRISDSSQCKSVVSTYLGKCLQNCEDEKVTEGILDHNDDYKKYIRLKISEKIVEWKKEYGQEMIKNIASYVNTYCGTTIFS